MPANRAICLVATLLLCPLGCASPPGTALPTRMSGANRDIVVVFDASKSSGDVWPDSDHAAVPSSYHVHEVEAVRAFLDAIDPSGAAVGLVAFSGGLPGTDWRNPQGESSPAWTEAPLTQDFAALAQALDRFERHVPEDNAHLAAGIDQGTIELAGLRGARSSPRLGAHPAMLILSDDLPELPYGPGAAGENLLAVERALARARRAGIACYLVALGRSAGSLAKLSKALESTGGSYLGAEDPNELVQKMSQLAASLSPSGPPP